MTRFCIEIWSIILGMMVIGAVLGVWVGVAVVIYRLTGSPAAMIWPAVLAISWMIGSPFNRWKSY